MKKTLILTVLVLALAPLAALAQADPTAPKAASASAPTTTSAPASKPFVMATVDKKEISSDFVDKMIRARFGNEVPQEDLPAARSEFLQSAIVLELMTRFLDQQKVEAADADLKAQKDLVAKAAAKDNMTVEAFMADRGITDQHMRDAARQEKLYKDTIAEEKVQAFIKANPHYFDGTKIKGSHILIKIDPITSTEDLKAAKARLEGIAADIKAGKITFEEAAKKFSDCPSKEKGGDLGEWTYVGSPQGGMDKLFSKAAFATKVGEVSGVVHTRFGFHIIKVTGLTEGKDKPDESTDAAAKSGVVAELQAQLFDLPMGTVKVVINK